jgi:carbon-monoxide dehydrogenase small subunit
VIACLTLAVEVRKNPTIEGLERGQAPPLQQAARLLAVQCGFCTPGMILSAKALLDKNPRPTEDEVKRLFPGTCAAAHGCEDY